MNTHQLRKNYDLRPQAFLCSYFPHLLVQINLVPLATSLLMDTYTNRQVKQQQ